MIRIAIYYCFIMIGFNSAYIIWRIIAKDLLTVAIGLVSLVVSIVCLKILRECKRILK